MLTLEKKRALAEFWKSWEEFAKTHHTLGDQKGLTSEAERFIHEQQARMGLTKEDFDQEPKVNEDASMAKMLANEYLHQKTSAD